MPPAGQRDEDGAAVMDQQLAVDAPVALPRETPYPFAALATVRSLRMGNRSYQARLALSRSPCHTDHWMRTRAADSEDTTPLRIQKVPHGEGPGTSFPDADPGRLSRSLPGLTRKPGGVKPGEAAVPEGSAVVPAMWFYLSQTARVKKSAAEAPDILTWKTVTIV